MTTKQIELGLIAVDASTQTRASIDESVVADYSDRMMNGAQFPPIVLFHDGNQYYIGDGFHRVLSTQRNGAVTVAADVRPGTREDALWFALGANREHGHQMTMADKKHAIEVAIKTWGDAKSSTQIAEQIGVRQQRVSEIRSALRSQVTGIGNLTTRVSGKDGKTYPMSRDVRPAIESDPRYERVSARVRAGEPIQDIAKAEHISARTVSAVKHDLGLGGPRKTKDAVQDRLDQIREMAGAGHTTAQIASAVGLEEPSCRNIIKREGIVVVADASIGSTRRHDPNRIVEHIVMDAENLTADVNLIDFAGLDRERLGDWIDGLTQSRRGLDAFIKRLIKTKEKHVEAA